MRTSSKSATESPDSPTATDGPGFHRSLQRPQTSHRSRRCDRPPRLSTSHRGEDRQFPQSRALRPMPISGLDRQPRARGSRQSAIGYFVSRNSSMWPQVVQARAATGRPRRKLPSSGLLNRRGAFQTTWPSSNPLPPQRRHVLSDPFMSLLPWIERRTRPAPAARPVHCGRRRTTARYPGRTSACHPA